MATIGIDLGTTNCCIAVMKHGIPDIIPDASNNRTIPSYILFTGDEILCGHMAKKKLIQFPESTIYDVKRMIGLSYKKVQTLKDRWKFTVLDNEKLQVQVKTKNETICYTPEELSSLLLKQLKQYAEERLDAKVVKAVITVPVHFNHGQRQATMDAGRLAGFEEIRLLNEPTAAALAFAFDQNCEVEKICFIFDFGGGTFDVSIITLKNKHVTVLAVAGDLNLGGGDIDNFVFNYFDKQIQNRTKFDVKTKNRVTMRVKAACVAIKEDLSFMEEAAIDLDSLFDNKDYELRLSRADFDNIVNPIVLQIKQILKKCLNKAQLIVSDIDEVIMVGGSSKIIKIKTLLKEFFGKEPKNNVNPDEVVALGAALCASEQVTFTDILPWSLGLNTLKDTMCKVIRKGSQIPYTKIKQFENAFNTEGHATLSFDIYYGEDKKTSNNKFLGRIKVIDLPAAQAGKILFYVRFTVDGNGILKVEVEDDTNEKMYNLTMLLDIDTTSLETLQIHE